MTEKIDTTALVSSRICHDLISPVGAISNGIELLSEISGQTPELQLISESVESAKSKLQFFRVCFGQSNAESVIGKNEIHSICDAMFSSSRMSFYLHMKEDHETRDVCRLLFLLLLCAETTLPIGGELNLIQEQSAWTITTSGKRIQRNSVWDIFMENACKETVAPAQVQFAIAKDQISNSGQELLTEFTENSVTITLSA